MSEPSRRPPRALALGAFALLCLIWSSTWLVIKEGVQDVPPATALALRMALAGLVFGIIARPIQRREGGGPPPAWMTVASGILVFAVPYALVYWAETIIDSGLASVLWAVYPLFLALIGHATLPGERLGGTQWLGFVTGFVGVVLLFVTDLRDVGAGIGFGLIYLLSPLTSAFGTMVIKRHGAKVSSALLNRNGLALATVLTAIHAVVAEHGATIRWTGMAVFSIAYLAIVGTVVTFGIYFWLLRHAPAHLLALIAYITPALALLLGAVVGDEHVGVETLAGLVLILFGVAAVARRSRSGAVAASAE